jgi:hypothetical protein
MSFGILGISEGESFTHKQKLGKAFPHQLITGFGIVLAAQVAPDAARSHTVARKFEGDARRFFAVSMENLQFDVGKQDFGRQFGSLTPQQSHQLDPPGNDQIDRKGTTEALGGFVADLLDAEPDLRTQ